MSVSPAPSKTHVRVHATENGQRKPVVEIQKCVLDDFRRHMLTSPDVPAAERRMHGEHNVPSDECRASAALFEIRRRKAELAQQAERLDFALGETRGKKEKLEQELFKSRNRFDSLVGTVSEASRLAAAAREAISGSEESRKALKENTAFNAIEARLIMEGFASTSAKYPFSPQELEKAMRESGTAALTELAAICESATEFLGNSCNAILPKAGELSDGIASGLRILRLGERAEIEAFLGIMAKSIAQKSDAHPRDRESLEMLQSTTGKVVSQINGLASAASKASASHLKLSRRGQAPPLPDSFGAFIATARETVAQLSAFTDASRNMLIAQGKYIKAMVKLDSLAKGQAGLAESMSQLPDISGDEKRLAGMRQELSKLDSLEPLVRAELGRLQNRRTEKEAKRQQHAQNRLSREEWEKAKRGIEPARSRFTYSKEPQCEPAMQDMIGARKQKFVEAALSLFGSSLGKNAMLCEQFEATLPELAELYLKGKGSINSKSLFARFPKRTKHEKILRNNANEYDIVRVGLSSINEYRLLIDVKNPRQPLIYFVGHKEDCEAFMKSLPRKISGCREKALSNGAGSLFAILSPE